MFADVAKLLMLVALLFTAVTSDAIVFTPVTSEAIAFTPVTSDDMSLAVDIPATVVTSEFMPANVLIDAIFVATVPTFAFVA